MFPARFLAQSRESIFYKCLQYVRIDFYAQGDAMRPPNQLLVGQVREAGITGRFARIF